MSSEEIRKLLGGYATNTLTESERKALFEAALDDQELFNALQDEETLRELLADPVARAQVRQALDQSASGRRHGAWWSRWWTWAGVAGAVATASVVFVATQSSLVITAKRETQIASAEKAPAPPVAEQARNREPEARAPEIKPKQAEKKAQLPDQQASLEKDTGAAKPASAATSAAIARDELANNIAAPSPPPLPPPAAQVSPAQQAGQSPQGASQGAVAGFRQSPAEPSTLRLKETSKLTATLGGAAPNNSGSVLRYSIIVNGAETPVTLDALRAGDEVRLRVSPGASGVLALYQQETAAEWKLLSSEPVQANGTYTVPSTPIRVQSSESKLRLTLDRSTTQALADSRVKAKRAESTSPSPVIVDITLAGK